MSLSHPTTGPTSQASRLELVRPFRPLPWQIEPWRDTSHKVVLLTGSAGGGKSYLAANKIHGFCLRYPGATALMLRKTRESMGNSTVLFMDRAVIGADPRVHHAQTAHRFEYQNGSVLAYGGMADDKQREQIRSIGQDGSVDIIWMEEANAFTEEDFDEVLARLRGRAAPWVQLVLSTNPDAPNHWINQRLIIGGQAAVYYSRAADNTYNPADYAETLSKMQGVLGDRLARGMWVSAEGAYFPEWREEVHTCEPFVVPKDWTRWTGIDYGYADPFCCLWLARNPSDRYHIYVYREAYVKGLRDEEQGKAIARASLGERVRWHIADPSTFNKRSEQDKPSIASVYYKAGVRPLAPGVNNRIAGWQVVKAALAVPEEGRPRLQVMRGRAPNLVRTIPSMVHDPLDSEDLADEVRGVKTEDHSVDALRYALMLAAMPPEQAAKLQTFRFEAG